MSATAADRPRGEPARDRDEGRPSSSIGIQFGEHLYTHICCANLVLCPGWPIKMWCSAFGHWYFAKALLVRTRVRLLERSKRHANRQIRVWAHLSESRTSVASYILPNAPWVQVDDSGTMPAAERSRYRPCQGLAICWLRSLHNPSPLIHFLSLVVLIL